MIRIFQYSMWPYNSQRPTEDGDEPQWTHISEFVPRSRSRFLFSHYWDAESEFVRVALRAAEWADAEVLSVDRTGSSGETITVAPNESVVDQVPIQHLDPVIRYNLRDYIWTRLFFEDKLYITFGYDMNMYIGFSQSLLNFNADMTQKIYCRDVSDRRIDTDFHFFGRARPEE
jgi:hypothetical protein